MITLDKDTCANYNAIRDKEWMITNGLGGYSSTTVSGMNTRRYHGLLVAALNPPVGRTVLLSKLEEALVIDGERVELSTNLYGGDVVHPAGHQHLESFSLDPFPVSTFCGRNFTLTKSLFMVHGKNTVAIEYNLTSNEEAKEILLEVRPLIAFRDFHATTHENETLNRSVRQTFGCVRVAPYSDMPELFLAHDADRVITDGVWYRNFEYAEEKARGLDCNEDLFSPIMFQTALSTRKRFVIMASTEEQNVADAAEFRRAAYRKDTLERFESHFADSSTRLVRQLEQAAEQFIVARPPLKTVIAGYHWFADWGRDTMIALPGLLLCNGQRATAREILLEFRKAVDGGMLPNRFPDRGESPEYNTVDATLWYFEAIWQYLHSNTDPEWREDAWHLIETEFYASLKKIVEAHLAGTRFGIHADADGFLWAGDASTQLTWMDAKVGDIAITPRSGRPVEIQALWYNALRIMEEFALQFKDAEGAQRYAAVADLLRDNFMSVFWNESAGCLFDVVDHDSVDASIRPNQVIAVSLRHSLIPAEQARQVLDVAARDLLTPFGLRTLAPYDQKYRGRYEGDVWGRDSAYHQGTVWPWLAGPYFRAKLMLSTDDQSTMHEIKEWLEGFSGHLREAGLGQVSEIFDGDAPHFPRGCIAQAWSVSELLRLAKSVTNSHNAPSTSVSVKRR